MRPLFTASRKLSPLSRGHIIDPGRGRTLSSAPSLYTRHLKIALGIAREFRFPGADADDVQQEARIALWEAARTHDKAKGTFPAYARTVIRRHLTDCLKAATREKRAILNTAARDEQLDLVPGRTDPAATLEARELLAAVDRLPLREKRVVVGRACGLSYAELGPPKVVDNLLVQARKRLKEAT